MAQEEAVERAVFAAPGAAEQFLAAVKAGSDFTVQRYTNSIAKYTLAVPNAPDPRAATPGYIDSISAALIWIVDPEKMTPGEVQATVPPAPAFADIMSVWRVADQPRSMWDGSMQSPIHRNISAAFGVVGDPSKLDLETVKKVTPFTQQMPAAPYPFDVDRDQVARGEQLFNDSCASCHAPGNTTVMPTSVIGTDPNRANAWTPISLQAVRQVLRSVCADAASCNDESGSPFTDTQIVDKTMGYSALPLTGIWARAPYLHNGSVPTLAALLTKDRPAKFYRGNVTYDQKNVGFTWDKPVTPGATLFDTTRNGFSNAGHDTAMFLGATDWANEPDKLNDLLAYLKTL
jgi:hypothetical protein